MYHISSLFGSCPKWPTGHPYFANYREEKAKAFISIKKLFFSGLHPVSLGLQSYQLVLSTTTLGPAVPSLGRGEDPVPCVRKEPREQVPRPREAERQGPGLQWFCLQVLFGHSDTCLHQGCHCPAPHDWGSWHTFL